MYATTPTDLLDTLRTAAVHCHRDGIVAVLPDYVRETFTPGTDEGGEDGSDGRALRYLEWRWDPNPSDDTYVVDYAFLLRTPDGAVSVVHDRHVEGLFARAQWLERFAEAGLSAHSSLVSVGPARVHCQAVSVIVATHLTRRFGERLRPRRRLVRSRPR